MNTNSLFEIRDLICSYKGKGDQNKKVLQVQRLYIPRGKFIILLGVSGSGKSTLLETLGLMNDTIEQGTKVTFIPEPGKERYQFEQILVNKDRNTLSNIRNRHFSFIFQENNLMPNFTAYENIALTQMMQGVSQKESYNNAKEIMNQIGLGWIEDDKKTFDLSGGQKQRIAFIRAVIPQFTVLMADEPTGNLDEKNSKELMTILNSNIKDNNRSAIIVSHNIDLSLEFADVIITLNKQDEYGEILEQNVFNSLSKQNEKTWKDSKGQPIKDIRSRIEAIIYQ
ncbi:MAG: ABC transporter ATP-binding protein [Bacteroidetes bacterium]|nr:ABC transporter ATP-binding protein [Bacteroidota bacterium]